MWLLSAPLTHRHNLDDPTAIFDTTETPGAWLRIGLAHGSIRDFGSRGEANNQIPTDRAERSNLDYLALEGWQGLLKIGGRTWYAGTPEANRFQRDAPGHMLLVDLEAGREQVVTPIRTGQYQWLMREGRINDAASFDAELDRLMGEVDPAATLLQLSLIGITSLTDRATISAGSSTICGTGSAIWTCERTTSSPGRVTMILRPSQGRGCWAPRRPSSTRK